jgi:hypothetical protein
VIGIAVLSEVESVDKVEEWFSSGEINIRHRKATQRCGGNPQLAQGVGLQLEAFNGGFLCHGCFSIN